MKIKTYIRRAIWCATIVSSMSLADSSNIVLRSTGPLVHSRSQAIVNSVGTKFEISPTTEVLINNQLFGYGIDALDHLTADGQLQASLYSRDMQGPVIAIHIATNQRYIPGATPVALRDTVKWVQPNLALMMVGQTIVDYSASLSENPSLAPKVGEEIFVNGIWPTSDFPLIARSVTASANSALASRNISNGISGSGVISSGISGSGAISTGISGSGAKALAHPIVSTGISGSGVISSGISGSGVMSSGISGSGAKASNRQAPSLGISGSGVISNGISGSGVISQGISGSGVVSTGISGSGHN